VQVRVRVGFADQTACGIQLDLRFPIDVRLNGCDTACLNANILVFGPFGRAVEPDE